MPFATAVWSKLAWPWTRPRHEFRTVALDVVIQTTAVTASASQLLLTAEPPPKQQFTLADDLWVGELDNKTAERVLDSCEPCGKWVKKPVRPYCQLYSFVRERAPDNPLYTWDSDRRLQTCIALSRLVHPTPISFEYAARITYNSDNSIREIIPGPVQGLGSEAYVANADCRTWLTTTDLKNLKELLAAMSATELPPRVKRALWHHEFAARIQEISVRWTLICTALEALVHTDRLGSTKQFTRRVSKLAGEFQTVQFSEDDAKEAYDFRSRISHGQGLTSLSDKNRDLYERMEELLRQSVVRAILNPDFAKIFSSDVEIKKHWSLDS